MVQSFDILNFLWIYLCAFICIAMCCPDLRWLKENGVIVGVMAGERSRDAHYTRTTNEEAKIPGSERMVVPGYHQGFELEEEVFQGALWRCFIGSR